MTLLAIALVAMVVNVWQGMVLLAMHHASASLRYLSITVAVNIALNVVLIPLVGPVGAAWGTLISALLMVALSTAALARRGAPLSAARIVRIAVAAGASAAMLGAARAAGVHWLLACAAAALTYAVGLVGTRVVRTDDIRSILRPHPAVADLQRSIP
jgi:O-antigen/teichoic acid export membrane protein